MLSSRTDQPFAVARLRAQGLADESPGSALRLAAEETAALVVAVLGPGAGPVATAMHAMTAGWPAAVRLVAEWWRPSPAVQWPALVHQAGDAGGPLAAFLVEEVLPATPPSGVGGASGANHSND